MRTPLRQAYIFPFFFECFVPNNPWNHVISEQAEDIVWYSDSVEDLENMYCFLLFQEMNALPKNMHQPVTEWRVSTHLA
jgi:hypothetical protein